VLLLIIALSVLAIIGMVTYQLIEKKGAME